MSRRLRREFQALEAQLDYGVQKRAWRALIDHIHGKGPGPKPIGDQLRLHARIRRLHARRDRYNQKRYARRYEALMGMVGPRHVMAVMAIRVGIVEADMNIRDILIGAMAGDRRLTRKFLEELETIYEIIHPAIPAWEVDFRRIEGEKQAQPAAREERQDFEQSLKPTPLPAVSPADIRFGFPVPHPLPDQSDAPDLTPAARAAS